MITTRALSRRVLHPDRSALLPPVSPNGWRGEIDRLVGPFSRRDVAERFVGATSDFGQFGDLRFRLFAQGDAWYLDVRES